MRNGAMPKFELRLPEQDLASWAARYSYPGEDEIVDVVAPAARNRGYLTGEEFRKICRWKSPRTQSRCAQNADDLVEEITRIALSSKHEQVKIAVLPALKGVGWPTASVILHFCDHGRYPILDFRALWSLNNPQPSQYTFDLWYEYTRFMRGLQERTGLSMRTLDRALWQFSKEHQS